MKIISGKLKGLSLYRPLSKHVRPTQNRVKEAIFNILGNDCSGLVVFDLCCGTGNLGLEAVSRDAEHTFFVDIDVRSVYKNTLAAKKINKDINVTIKKQRVQDFLERINTKADIVFLDPPWKKKEVYVDTLQAIFAFDILTSNGVIIYESSKKENISVSDSFLTEKKYTYGDTLVTVLRYK